MKLIREILSFYLLRCGWFCIDFIDSLWSTDCLTPDYITALIELSDPQSPLEGPPAAAIKEKGDGRICSHGS